MGGPGANGVPPQQPMVTEVQPQLPLTTVPTGSEGNNAPNLHGANMARKPSTQKARAAAKATAPSQVQPEFLIGAASPQGTPLYHSNTGFQAANLQLPPPKKRRQNDRSESLTSTPLLGITGAPTTAIPMVEQPPKTLPATAKAEIVKMEEAAPAKTIHPFKCPIPHCDLHVIGMESQGEVDKHAAEAHDYHGDALAWCLANMQRALGLDSNGKILKDAPKVTTDNSTSTDGKVADQASSRLVVASVKNEMLTPGATPMSRAPTTQAGIKVETPSNNSLKTPQTGFKPGSPETSGNAMKRTASVLVDNMRTPSTGAPKPQTPPEDLWAKSLVRPEAIAYAFSGLEGFTSFENIPSPPPVVWADTPESGESSASAVPSNRSSTTSAVRVTMADWDPFGVHKDQKVEVIPVDEEWTKMDFTERYGERAGLDDDPAEVEAAFWKIATRAAREPELDFELIDAFEWPSK